MTLNRKLAPAIKDAIDFNFKLPPVQTYTLSNSNTLYWFRSEVQEVVEINWVFPAGLWYEEKSAVAQATAAQLKSGTTSKNALAVNEALEFYGASLKVSTNNDYTSITLDALHKHLPTLLPIVEDIIKNAAFPEEELNIYKQNTTQRLIVSMRNCEFIANQQIDAALFGKEHPYGRYTEQLSIEQLHTDDLKAYHKKHLNIANASIFMSGYVSEEDCKLIDNYFGKADTQTQMNHNGTFDIHASEQNKIMIENDANGVQTAIRIGRRFINRNHPDFAECVILNTILGGYFGSRLMSNIREDKGYTYGIYSSIGAFKNDASLTIHTEVGAHVTQQALDEIYTEMNTLCSEKVEHEELLLVKNYLLGSILGDLDGPFSIMQRWKSLILNGFTEDKFYENIAIYKAVTPEKLLQLAQTYFNPNDFKEVVVH